MATRKARPDWGGGSRRGRLQEDLEFALSLLHRGKTVEAIGLLEELAEEHPGQQRVLELLASSYSRVEDPIGLEEAARRLHEAAPDDPVSVLTLAGAHVVNGRPLLSLQRFAELLRRWPEHPRAAQVRESMAELEAALPEFFRALGLEGPDALEIATMQERVEWLTIRSQLPEARRLAMKLLEQKPGFVPALNSLTIVHMAEGHLQEAIATANQTLTHLPGSLAALTELVRLHCMLGRFDEARSWAEQLAGREVDSPETALALAQAHSFLGDDDPVLEVFEAVRETSGFDDHPMAADLYHLAAAAAARKGKEGLARRWWQQALKLRPGHEEATANMEDLPLPPHERQGPFALDLNDWLTIPVLQQLSAHMDRLIEDPMSEAASRFTRRLLREHPEVARLAPTLLERGDGAARSLLVGLAEVSRDPHLLPALRDFALSQYGPDSLRVQAAEVAVWAGLIQPGPVRLWIEGSWRELLLLNVELHGEPAGLLKGPVRRLAEEAGTAMRAGRYAEAEGLWKKAASMKPEDPMLAFNASVTLQAQGRLEEAEAMVVDIHRRHPDYLFARVRMADIARRDGRLEEAHALLAPLLDRKRMHYSEFAAVCQAQIGLLMDEGKREAAEQWLEMWESADPENPLLELSRAEVRGVGGGLFKRLTRHPAKRKK